MAVETLHTRDYDLIIYTNPDALKVFLIRFALYDAYRCLWISSLQFFFQFYINGRGSMILLQFWYFPKLDCIGPPPMFLVRQCAKTPFFFYLSLFAAMTEYIFDCLCYWPHPMLWKICASLLFLFHLIISGQMKSYELLLFLFLEVHNFYSMLTQFRMFGGIQTYDISVFFFSFFVCFLKKTPQRLY